ncbi:UNVERIFIED_ORG: hypothetical protein ABIB52_000895 [Arthrobacter sp. UYCu721]
MQPTMNGLARLAKRHIASYPPVTIKAACGIANLNE